LADALHAACGVWFDEFPFIPERILRGLGKIK
jgi:CO/xanthine dehydrogenase Mo-binding subunit